MVWVSSGAVGVLRRCFSRLLGRPASGFVLSKIRNLALTAGVTTMILMMVIVASAGTGVVRRLGWDPTLIRLVLPIVALVLLILVCFVMHWVLGGRSLRWRPACYLAALGLLLGAGVAARVQLGTVDSPRPGPVASAAAKSWQG